MKKQKTKNPSLRRPTLENTPIKRLVFGEKPPKTHILEDGKTRVKCFGPDHLDCTFWEELHNVDMLGPDYTYNIDNERFVLDWDDTCKDTGKFWIQAHREVLQDFGFNEGETSDTNILKLFGNIHVGNTLGIERFVKEGKQFSDDEVWVLIKERARELLRENPMDPLLIKALHLAKQMEVRMAVWSSSPRELLLEAIEMNGLEDVFDAVVSVDDVDPDKHKPYPQGLIMAVQAMDVASGYLQPGEQYSENTPLDTNGVWMIGDSPNDILAGQQVGASTVWLENPLQGHNAHEKRRAVMSALTEAASGTTVLEDAIDHMRPTLVVRTFDPEEAGFGRNVPLSEMPVDVVRKLGTTNYNFARFLIDRNSRALLHRRAAVRAALARQNIATQLDDTVRVFGDNPHEAPIDSVEDSIYGGKLTGVRRLTDRQFGQLDDDVSNRTIASILARLEGPWV